MNRRSMIILRREKEKTKPTENVKMSQSEKLSLLSEIERIVNSQHVALISKIARLREALEQAEN